MPAEASRYPASAVIGPRPSAPRSTRRTGGRRQPTATSAIRASGLKKAIATTSANAPATQHALERAGQLGSRSALQGVLAGSAVGVDVAEIVDNKQRGREETDRDRGQYGEGVIRSRLR